MIASGLILLVATLALAAYTWRTRPAHLVEAVRFTREEGVRLALRLPLALIAASCLAELIPDAAIAAVMGPDTGMLGIAAAAFAGGLLPGGPMVSFPLVLVLARDGAGPAQLIALVTGWSVFAIHRVIAYEGPMMGWRFVVLRFASSWFVPLAAGALAALVIGLGVEVSIRGL